MPFFPKQIVIFKLHILLFTKLLFCHIFIVARLVDHFYFTAGWAEEEVRGGEVLEHAGCGSPGKFEAKSKYCHVVVEQHLTLDFLLSHSIWDCFLEQENNCYQQNVNMLLLLSWLHTERSIKQLVITCLGRGGKRNIAVYASTYFQLDSQLQRFMFGSERAPMNGSGQTLKINLLCWNVRIAFTILKY